MKKNNLHYQKKFLERAKTVHGEKYDYSLVRYKGASTKVAIGCPKHGLFYQTPSQHLTGNGCPFCNFSRMTREEFLKFVHNKYGDKYEYSKCSFTHETKTSDLITITCKVHGDFQRRAKEFLNGLECPKCSKELKRKTKQQQTNNVDNYTKPKEVLKIRYSAIIRYKEVKSQVCAITSSDPFETKTEAEEFIATQKMLLEMADFEIIESSIIENEHRYLDRKSAIRLFLLFKIESYDQYIERWDKWQPQYLPRNLYEHYYDVDSMFGGSEVDTIQNLLIKANPSDWNQRLSA
jgi:hypothetical protein